jgi:hypothetical protein
MSVARSNLLRLLQVYQDTTIILSQQLKEAHLGRLRTEPREKTRGRAGCIQAVRQCLESRTNRKTNCI